mmetsp:Transcript_11950/g.31224  ORF Transcript_11950/g.31224 Transcript_11950/m.31224 type:complete len:449 (-) Transcript_11950:1415-2761(-)
MWPALAERALERVGEPAQRARLACEHDVRIQRVMHIRIGAADGCVDQRMQGVQAAVEPLEGRARVAVGGGGVRSAWPVGAEPEQRPHGVRALRLAERAHAPERHVAVAVAAVGPVVAIAVMVGVVGVVGVVVVPAVVLAVVVVGVRPAGAIAVVAVAGRPVLLVHTAPVAERMAAMAVVIPTNTLMVVVVVVVGVVLLVVKACAVGAGLIGRRAEAVQQLTQRLLLLRLRPVRLGRGAVGVAVSVVGGEICRDREKASHECAHVAPAERRAERAAGQREPFYHGRGPCLALAHVHVHARVLARTQQRQDGRVRHVCLVSTALLEKCAERVRTRVRRRSGRLDEDDAALRALVRPRALRRARRVPEGVRERLVLRALAVLIAQSVVVAMVMTLLVLVATMKPAHAVRRRVACRGKRGRMGSAEGGVMQVWGSALHVRTTPAKPTADAAL